MSRGDLRVAYIDALDEAAPGTTFTDAIEIWHDIVTSPTEYDIEMINKAAMIADEGLAIVISEMCTGIPEQKVRLESLNRRAELGPNLG